MMQKILVFTPLALFIFATTSAAAPGDTVYSRPGQIVFTGDGARLNLYCLGTGSPTMVMESGWGGLGSRLGRRVAADFPIHPRLQL